MVWGWWEEGHGDSQCSIEGVPFLHCVLDPNPQKKINAQRESSARKASFPSPGTLLGKFLEKGNGSQMAESWDRRQANGWRSLGREPMSLQLICPRTVVTHIPLPPSLPRSPLNAPWTSAPKPQAPATEGPDPWRGQGRAPHWEPSRGPASVMLG